MTCVVVVSSALLGSCRSSSVLVAVCVLILTDQGYGWSEGRPLVSRLWDDVRDLLVALPDLLCSTASQAVVFSGRSLGAHCALHAALTADVPARLESRGRDS